MSIDEYLDKLNTYYNLYLNECLYSVKDRLLLIIISLVDALAKGFKEMNDGSNL